MRRREMTERGSAKRSTATDLGRVLASGVLCEGRKVLGLLFIDSL
jgi:hypothetical protein